MQAASDWAYGEAGSSGNFESIGKNADLVFDLEIVGVQVGAAAPGVDIQQTTTDSGEQIVKLGLAILFSVPFSCFFFFVSCSSYF